MGLKKSQLGGWLGLIAISLVCFPLAAFGATLSASDAECDAGDTDVVISIYLAVNSGEEIASLQFDLHYDVNQLDFVAAEIDRTVAQNLGKIAEYNIISDGVVRFVIYGQNQNIITDGIILEVTFDADADAPEGQGEISFSNFIAASPDAQYVTLSTQKGIVDVLKGGTTDTTTDTNTDTNTDTTTNTSADSGGGGGGGGGGCFIGSMSFWN